MASGDASKNSRPDRDWKTRDQPPREPPTGPSGSQAGQDPPQGPTTSLRARIGDKDARPIPQGPSGYRNEPDRRGEGSAPARDDRDSGRKRASSGKLYLFS